MAEQPRSSAFQWFPPAPSQDAVEIPSAPQQWPGQSVPTPGAPTPPAQWPSQQSPAPPAAASSGSPRGDEIGSESWGFKLRPPSGWKHQQEAERILMGHDTIPGLIIIEPHYRSSMSEVRAELQRGTREEGIDLRLNGTLKQFSRNGLAGQYQGVLDGTPVRAWGIGTLSPHGNGGVYISVLTTPEKFAQEHIAAAESTARGIRYIKLNTSGMMRHFADTWVHMSSSGSTLINLVLHPNGTFERAGETSYSGEYSSSGWTMPDTNWGAFGASSDAGRWSVRGNQNRGQIILNYANGQQEVINYRIHERDGRTYNSEYYFDGVYYFRKSAWEASH
ncbi:MAG: hypothetical protein ABW082_02940 [Sedimenticola sp.]